MSQISWIPASCRLCIAPIATLPAKTGARRNERSVLSVDYGSEQPGSNVSGAGAVNTTW